MFEVRVFTLYPEVFPGFLDKGLYGKALSKKIWNLKIFNIRDFAEDKHKTVDDTPFGGGSGMLMRADVIAKSLDKNIINIITLGCSKNIYDSEVLMGQLKANKKKVVHEKKGNIVVINTCGFINNAKEESINTILEYVDKKKSGEIDYAKGANLAGFVKVAKAMLAYGIV